MVGMQRFITSDGVALAYEIYDCQANKSLGEHKSKSNLQNNKPLATVIWSHGFTGSARNWRSTVKRLPEYRHITYDLRGHARSGAPTNFNDYSLARLAQDLIELARHEHVNGPLYLVGLSLGAMVAFEACRQSPALFDKVVLSSLPDPSNVQGLSKKAKAFAQAIRTEGLEVAGDEFVWGDSSGFSKRDAALVKQGFLEHPAYSLAHILEGVLAVLPSCEQFADGLNTAGLPALFLFGQHDNAASDYTGRVKTVLALKGKTFLKTCCFFEISSGGHLLNLTSGQVFAEKIAYFFNENFSTD